MLRHFFDIATRVREVQKFKDDEEIEDFSFIFDLNETGSKEVILEEVVDESSNAIEASYDTLVSMFPSVDKGYIKEICINPPFVKVEDDCLIMLINHLLGHESQSSLKNVRENTDDDEIISRMMELEDLQQIEKHKSNEEMLNQQLFYEFLDHDTELRDEKLQILVNILPDADPESLKSLIEGNESLESLNALVDLKLMNKDYDKRDQYYAKIKIKEKIEQYTTSFNIENYLKLFPEPFEYFENKQRECVFQQEAVDYLRNRYNSYPEDYIKRIYSQTKYNLSITDRNLKEACAIDTCKKLNISIQNTSLLQEIAFIENKVAIQRYLDMIQQKREKDMQFFRAQKLLLECQCCYNEIKPYECIECDNSHIFCKNCVIKGTQSVISESKTSVLCFMGCGNEFSLSLLRKILAPITYDIFLKNRQEAEIIAAKLDNLITCPFCPYSMEISPEIKIFFCKNPECMKNTCRLCKKINHLPLSCQDASDNTKGRIYIEEEMSDALIRRCHSCNNAFIKEYGCNKMVCSKCGAMSCYICRQPISGYGHFDGNSKCGTHQNSTIFDTEQIQLRKVQAITKVQNEHPDFKIPDV